MNTFRKIIGILIYFNVYRDICWYLDKKPISLREAMNILEEEC